MTNFDGILNEIASAFSKPRNDEFYGILKFPRLKIPPNPQKCRDLPVKLGDDTRRAGG